MARLHGIGWIAVVFAVLALVGCGGGEGGGSSPEPQVANPVANAGVDQIVRVGDAVSLDGRESTTAAGRNLTFTWTILSRPAGSAAALSDPSWVNPAFTADIEGRYEIGLVAGDSINSSPVDSMTVTATAQNVPPVANAGVAQNVLTGITVTLDGSQSKDADNDPLTYLWSLKVAPAGSGASLSDVANPKPTFTADSTGTYTFQLVVNDGKTSSSPSLISVNASSSPPPVAIPGPDQSVTAGTLVNLNGSASTNASTFLWTLVAKPKASTLTDVVAKTTSNPSFTPDVPGSYLISLLVSNAVGSGEKRIAINVSPAPVPVANAGTAQQVTVGTLVTLDGSGSTPVGIQYLWSFASNPATSAATLTDANTAHPKFTPDVAGQYVLKLTASNASGSNDATVTITAIPPTPMPIAKAGDDQSVTVGAPVNLDGSGSTNAASYSWSITQRPPGATQVVNNPTSDKPDFTPDVAGVYVVTLTVTNSAGSSSDTVSITANVPLPVANAGPDQTVSVNSLVNLSGAASTNTASFNWSITTSPPGGTAALTGANTPTPSFSPDVAGTYVVTLTANNGAGGTNQDTVSITAIALPVANAGPDQTVSVNTLANLIGAGSTNAASFSWSITTAPSGGTTALTGANTPTPSFTPNVTGTYIVTLTATSAAGSTNQDTVSITAIPLPVANAGPDQTVSVNSLVSLTGAGSTHTTGYSWSVTTAPPGGTTTLTNANTATPSLTPNVAGTYIVTLTATNATGSTNQDAVSITAVPLPVANAGLDQTVSIGTPVSLSGAGSTNAASFSWSITTTPIGGTLLLTGAGTANPSFTPNVPGNYVVTLTATNSTGSTSQDTVSITAIALPVANAGPDQTVSVNTPVGLNGAGSTGASSFSWSITASPPGGTTTLTGANTPSPSFTPNVAGIYVVTLTATNATGSTHQDTVNITAVGLPLANAGPDQTVSVNTVVNFNGTGSTNAVSFNWAITSGPLGGTIVLSGANTATPSFTPNVAGIYIVTLTAANAAGSTNQDTVSITAIGLPVADRKSVV